MLGSVTRTTTEPRGKLPADDRTGFSEGQPIIVFVPLKFCPVPNQQV